MYLRGSTVVGEISGCADMRVVRTVLLSWWICTSATIVQGEAENEASLPEEIHLRRSYRRPHVQRVWIVRPVDSINHNIRQGDNYTDPVRSFAVAIRDPETFLRFLRHEESQRLGKQNWTSYNQVLPSSRHVQMQILSQSESTDMSPLLNVVVEQDNKMDMNSFMDLMDRVSYLSGYNKKSSEYNNEGMSISELREEQKPTWTQPYMQQKYEQNENSLHKQQPTERNMRFEGERDVKLKESAVELERGLKEQPVRKTDRRHRERHYRQRDGVAEPMLIMGEFGKRNPNYSRPSTLPFNRQKSQDISTAPSLLLLPPVFSTYRRIDLPQTLPSSTETPVTESWDDSSSSKRKKRPLARNSRRPVDVTIPYTDISQSSIHTLRVYNESNPLTTNVSLVSTEIPRQSTENDISHVHISIPRIYTSVSHPHADVSASPYTDISRVHIAISRQPLNPRVSPASSRSTKKVAVSPPNSELSPETTTIPSLSTESIQPDDSFRVKVNILPPSVHILPPVLTSLMENLMTKEPPAVPQDSEGDDEFYVGNNPTYSSYQREAFGEPGAVTGRSYAASHPVVTRNMKTVQRDDADGGGGGRQPAMRRESEYGELRLTAAETAYYRRRQLRKPSVVLEITEETGSIPGVPGRDYPIYSQPPKTNFACVKGHGGYYADISTRCQVFFVCSDDGRGEPMLCPNGTLFHQDFLVCDWWFNVACGGVP